MNDSFDIGDFDPAPPASAPDFSYLESLNEGQRAAVEAVDGPVLVLAGAGTGKTRVLITRLAHILNVRAVNPWEILAVTFTNKAAAEMQQRIADLVGPKAREIKLGTFHSIGVWMLRRHGDLVGLKSSFSILDTDDQLRLLKQILLDAGMDVKKWSPRGLAAVIDRWKDKGLRPDQLGAEDNSGFADGRAREFYGTYQSRLLALNACDFGDLLLHPLTILQKNPDILQSYQRRFQYILVDEYQDTNVAQYLLLRLLAQHHKNICCVGDDDQSIYGWRGAEVGNILRFEDDFPGARIVRLERNYRSTSHILGAASGLIDKNEGRLGKTLWTEQNIGEKLILKGVWDGGKEAQWVGEEIETLQRSDMPLSEMAILVRASFQTRDFEECFLSMGIPYKVIGGLRFYERREIRDVLAYLRVINQSADDLAFERIYNLPKRGLGTKALDNLRAFARMKACALYDAAAQADQADMIKGKTEKSFRELVEKFENWRELKSILPLHELTETLLEESGYLDMWKQDKSPEAQGKRENLRELVEALAAYDSLDQFLEHVALVMENAANTSSDMVSIMTLHSAKGLEFDAVFLPGWEEGLFPHQRALDENGLKALEEERRLAYVGITRARKRCFISHATNRRVHGQWQNSLPSRFVSELPTEHYTEQSENGLYRDQSRQRAATTDPAWRDTTASHLGDILSRRAARNRDMVDNSMQAVSGSNEDRGLKVGQRVFHQKFGYGRITRKDGPKLDINFEKAGQKKVMESFVETT